MTAIVAATTQQKIGVAVAVLLFVGWLAYLVLYARRPERPPVGSELELAPNRKPYLDDETLEGRKLDRALSVSLVLLVVSAVGLPLYWLNEPSRQAGADRGFDKRAAQRGFILFQPADSPVPAGNVGHFGCGGCHGSEGQGGVAAFAVSDPLDPSAPPRQVQWQAPELRTVTLRYNDDQLRQVLVYGRPGTPMPPWGVEGGGPMNAQQIDDLIAYLHSIAPTSKEAQQQAMKDVGADGQKLFEAFCARCHTKGWSINEPETPGGGAFGPNLTNGATLRQFPSVEEHVNFVAEGALLGEGATQGKNYGVRGVFGYDSGGMPFFGRILTQEQIRAIVDYERSL